MYADESPSTYAGLGIKVAPYDRKNKEGRVSLIKSGELHVRLQISESYSLFAMNHTSIIPDFSSQVSARVQEERQVRSLDVSVQLA